MENDPLLDPNSLIYIPYPRVNCLKTIPFTAAHTYIAHIWQYPPLPRGLYPEVVLFFRICFARYFLATFFPLEISSQDVYFLKSPIPAPQKVVGHFALMFSRKGKHTKLVTVYARFSGSHASSFKGKVFQGHKQF